MLPSVRPSVCLRKGLLKILGTYLDELPRADGAWKLEQEPSG